MSAPLPNLFPWAPLLVVVVVALFALLVIYAVMREADQARTWRKDLLAMVDRGEKDSDLNRDLLETARAPAEVRGLTRGLISLFIVALIGIALVVAMFSSATDSGDVRKNIITALTTVLATLAGFYFGSRTTSTAAGEIRPVKSSRTTARGPDTTRDGERSPGTSAPPEERER